MYSCLRISLLSSESVIKSVVRNRGGEYIIGIVHDSSPFLHKRKRFRVGGIFCEEVFGRLYVCSNRECGRISGFNSVPILRRLCCFCGSIMGYNIGRKYRFGSIFFNFPVLHCFAYSFFDKILTSFRVKFKDSLFLGFLFSSGSDFSGEDDNLFASMGFVCGKFVSFVSLVYTFISSFGVFSVKCRGAAKYSSLTTSRFVSLTKFYGSIELFKKIFLVLFPVLPCGLRVHSLDNRTISLNTKLNSLYNHIINTNNKIIEESPYTYSVKNIFILNFLVSVLLSFSDLGVLFQNDQTLYDRVKGKYGLFRQNLLGFRVDYSGRAVIVPGPGLSMSEVGLPYGFMSSMLLTYGLYRPDNNYVANLQGVDESIVYKGLIHDKFGKFKRLTSCSVIVNRAPTLHKMNIQSFTPVFSEGEVIKFMPLLCVGYNADFDGDQMGVFSILNRSSMLESLYMLRPSVNLYSPTTNKTLFNPTQGSLAGSYVFSVFNYFRFTNFYIFENCNAVLEVENARCLPVDGVVMCRLGSLGDFYCSSVGRFLVSLL